MGFFRNFLSIKPRSPWTVNPDTGARIAAVDTTGATKVATESGTVLDVTLPDAALEADGAIRTSVQDNTAELIDLRMGVIKDTITVITDPSVGDTSIDIETTGTTPLVNQYLCLKQEEEFFQAKILSVANISGNQYTLGLDQPLDSDFDITSGCSIIDVDLSAAAGSLGSPIIATLGPAGPGVTTNVQWDITRIMIFLEGTGTMDTGKFGDISGLSSGFVLRTKRNNMFHNLFNAKTNGEIIERCYDATFSDKAPAGVSSVSFRRTFAGQSKNGAAIRLSADTTDQLQILIQDDATGLTFMHVVVQGHVVTNS